MGIRLFFGIVGVIAFGAPDHDFRLVAAAPVACESLREVTLANGSILAAESVQAGAFMPPTPPNANAANAFKTFRPSVGLPPS